MLKAVLVHGKINKEFVKMQEEGVLYEKIIGCHRYAE